MNVPTSLRNIGWQVLCWVIVGALLWRYVMITAEPFFNGWQDWLVFYMLAIISYYVAIRRYARMMAKAAELNAKKVLESTGKMLLVLLFLSLAFSWYTGALRFGFSEDIRTNVGIRNLLEVVTVLGVVILFAYFVYAQRWGVSQHLARIGTEVKLRRIEKKLNTIQQSWVQQDLTPHLLFNSLSVARGLIRKNPVKARMAMSLIGDLAKYYVTKCKAPEIPLREELIQLSLLEKLYALRYGADLALDIQLPEEVDRLTIVPMLLINLLENIAKHGIVTDQRQPAIIGITHDGTHTVIRAQNPVAPGTASVPEGLGIAIKTIRKQLNLRYAGQCGVETSLVDEVFTMTIFYLH